ncbi:GxxExxY protein [Acidobacteria bacterium AH-259-L09]|nr:GxxExxY protein [Acidobacteria bacterium AH-259-L09]
MLELKAVEHLHPKFTSQLIEYLSATGFKLGFLINFSALEKLEYKRIIL